MLQTMLWPEEEPEAAHRQLIQIHTAQDRRSEALTTVYLM